MLQIYGMLRLFNVMFREMWAMWTDVNWERRHSKKTEEQSGASRMLQCCDAVHAVEMRWWREWKWFAAVLKRRCALLKLGDSFPSHWGVKTDLSLRITFWIHILFHVYSSNMDQSLFCWWVVFGGPQPEWFLDFSQFLRDSVAAPSVSPLGQSCLETKEDVLQAWV